MNGGTSIVPNLDSIEEFACSPTIRPQYGTTTAGSSTSHEVGQRCVSRFGFEFFRNTALDARNTSLHRASFNQNQPGGTLAADQEGKDLLLRDYQARATTQGWRRTDCGASDEERLGNFSDVAGSLRRRERSILADLLSQRLGRAYLREAYYTPGCTNAAQCVFPNA